MTLRVQVADYPDNSAFIGYDTGDIGELAGKWLITCLRGKSHPRVLVIASSEHQRRRQCCEQALRAALPDAVLTVDDGCAFLRSRAHDAVRGHVGRLPTGGRLDAIFCTDDETALGAVDALSPPSPATSDTVVIGVDGSLEARALIGTGRSHLRATVVQDSHRLAVSVVDLLAKTRRRQPVPRRTILRTEIYQGH